MFGSLINRGYVALERTFTWCDRQYLFRVTLYILEFFVLFSLQQIPGLLPEFFGGKPLLILSLFLSISILESDQIIILVAIFCGLVLDLSLGGYIGIQTVMLTALRFIMSKIKRKIRRGDFIVLLFASIIFVPLVMYSRFYTHYVLSGFLYPEIAFFNHILPSVVYTVCTVPIIYFFNRPVVSSINAARRL